MVHNIMTSLTLAQLDGLFAICRLTPRAPLPAWTVEGPASSFVSVTRTTDELTVICRQDLVPEGVRCERGWRALRVAGTLDFALIGVLASLLAPLAEAGVAVLAVSTFDTDYLFVRDDRLAAAVAVLRREGHRVESV